MSLPDFANRVLDRCASTNNLARELGENGAPHGTWVSARIQEQGRGRLGRQWQSQEGNLFLSVVVRVADKSCWTWIPLATAIAVARCLRSRYPALDLRIKWPNDLWIIQGSNHAKLGGILCEAVGQRGDSFIIIGLGLNCANAPEGLDQDATSLSQALAPARISADEVRGPIIETLLSTIAELSEQGVSGLIQDYDRWAALERGMQIEWGADQRGTVQGLGELGELLVQTSEGSTKLYAEDVRVKIRKASGGSLA